MKNVRILYTNWKGETEWRNIIPLVINFDSNEYHQERQWLLTAWDNDKSASRTFAMADIHKWEIDK
jgi:predicted DNA-binding transcriptional regulator YafY